MKDLPLSKYPDDNGDMLYICVYIIIIIIRVFCARAGFHCKLRNQGFSFTRDIYIYIYIYICVCVCVSVCVCVNARVCVCADNLLECIMGFIIVDILFYSREKEVLSGLTSAYMTKYSKHTSSCFLSALLFSPFIMDGT